MPPETEDEYICRGFRLGGAELAELSKCGMEIFTDFRELASLFSSWELWLLGSAEEEHPLALLRLDEKSDS